MWSSNLDTSSGGGFLDNSRKGGQGVGKTQRAQNIVPAMIGQLVSAPSTDEIKFWGIPARMFSILGIVQNIEETTTKISYNVEDETGTITALKWLEADKKASDVTMKMNTYVRIIGLLREQNDKRHLLILRMWPLEDLNEMTGHALEIIYMKLKSKVMNKTKVEEGTHQSGPSDDSNYYGMTGDQILIYKIIQAHNNAESGIERAKIKSEVPKRILSDVDNILEDLVSEGHIYTTRTEDYFKSI